LAVIWFGVVRQQPTPGMITAAPVQAAVIGAPAEVQFPQQAAPASARAVSHEPEPDLNAPWGDLLSVVLSAREHTNAAGSGEAPKSPDAAPPGLELAEALVSPDPQPVPAYQAAKPSDSAGRAAAPTGRRKKAGQPKEVAQASAEIRSARTRKEREKADVEPARYTRRFARNDRQRRRQAQAEAGSREERRTAMTSRETASAPMLQLPEGLIPRYARE
jgi:hypothetical protein